MRPFRLLLAIGCIVAIGIDAAIQAVHAAPYVSAAAISPMVLNPPPAVHSAVWDKEVADVLALQYSADKAEVEKASAERNMKPELLTLAVDPQLTRVSYPALYALLDNVSDTSRSVTDNVKNYWNTKRPYLMDERIKPLVEPHDNPSYPSGHTSGSYVWARVLALVMPEKREAFLSRAEEIAQHRVLVGMHYPHDVTAGKELALITFGALLGNTSFQGDVEKAKTEQAKHTTSK